jgi:hypothetical protein
MMPAMHGSWIDRCCVGQSFDSTHIEIDRLTLRKKNKNVQINVANVDPEKGTYAVGDFKTVALAGYIRAKVCSKCSRGGRLAARLGDAVMECAWA